MKYYYYLFSRDEYFRNDSIIDDVMLFLHRIYVPARLSTILHKAQLIAFLTSNSSSNNNFLIPVMASLTPIFCKPEPTLINSPNKSVAYLRILTT